jgi:hypothetical protein
MAKKSNTASEPVLSGAAAPARSRKHAPAKHTTPAVESSPSAEIIEADAPASDEIARLAYSYWEARGYQGGSSEEDWLRAEQELRGNRADVARA